MKGGDLIRHKRSNTLGIILEVFESKKNKFATVFFVAYREPSTAFLKILEDNWEVISGN